MYDFKFLFDNQLIAELEALIKNSKHKLILISPFIDLDKRIQDALREKINKPDFELLVLFGKNEDNIYRSIKRDSLEFLKQFPNVEIRYNERLHAKFYLNDYDFIVSSMNLYDFSLANNIEVGVMCNYASKGIIGKVADSANSQLSQVVDKVSQNILGVGHGDVNPIEKFETIFLNSEIKYKAEPIFEEKTRIAELVTGKKMNGSRILIDKLIVAQQDAKPSSYERNSYTTTTSNTVKTEIVESSQVKSASQLSKAFGVASSELTNLMQKRNLIDGDKITELGKSKGLVMKNYMGNNYIAYPENLPEFEVFKK